MKRLIAGFLVSVAAVYALLFGLLAGALLLVLYGGIAVLAWLAGARRSRAAGAFPEVDLAEFGPVPPAPHPPEPRGAAAGWPEGSLGDLCNLPPCLEPLPPPPDMEPGRKRRRRVELHEIAEARDRDRRPPENA